MQSLLSISPSACLQTRPRWPTHRTSRLLSRQPTTHPSRQPTFRLPVRKITSLIARLIARLLTRMSENQSAVCHPTCPPSDPRGSLYTHPPTCSSISILVHLPDIPPANQHVRGLIRLLTCRSARPPADQPWPPTYSAAHPPAYPHIYHYTQCALILKGTISIRG